MELKEFYEKQKGRLEKYNLKESMKNNIKVLIEGAEGLGLGINVVEVRLRKKDEVWIEIANDSYYLIVIANSRFFKMGLNHIYNSTFECFFKCGSSHIDEAVGYIKEHFTE